MIVPLIGALASLIAGRLSARLATAVAGGTLAISGGILVAIAPQVYGGHVLFHSLGGWVPIGGHALGIGWAADAFGLTYALTSVFVGLAVVLCGADEVIGLDRAEAGRLWCLSLLLIAGLVGTALTADLFNMFVWFELAAVASYGLTAFHLERPSALEAAFKIAVLTTIAGFLVFIGVGLLYAQTGALKIGQLHQVLAQRHGSLGTGGAIAVALLIAGFATKAGLVPFHPWLPDAHSVAPGPISALFSGVMVSMRLVAIARVALLVVPRGTSPLLGLLTALGGLSALIGSAMAFGQDDLKRLLAYDTVAQMGIVAVALGTGSNKGFAGATWQLLNHGLSKALLFGVAGMLAHAVGTTSLSRMGGLWRRHRLLAVLFGVGIASIIGVPPFNGYASRVLIHGSLVDAHAYGILAVVEVAEVLSAAALLRAGWQAFVASPGPDEPPAFASPRAASRVGGTVLAAACLAFGLGPARWLANMAGPAAAVLAAPGRYATAVTSSQPGGRLAIHNVAVPGSFVSSEVLLSTLLVVVLGAAGAWWKVRAASDPLPIRWLRRLHTGSVNDDATALAAGLLVVVVAMVH